MRMVFLRLVSVVFSAVCLSACFSPKFNAAWKNAETSGGDARKWSGRWESDRGTGGRLRAVVKAPRGGELKIYFEAGWHGFTTAYPVVLRADAETGGFKVYGEHKLESFVGGGLYKYDGRIAGEKFSVRYASSYDTGTFSLTPEPVH